MCGFVAMIGLNGAAVEPAVVKRMCASIRHRGPDGEGDYFAESVGFGFRRLAILDLSDTGHQPMCSRDGTVVLVFNGELYNFVELRRELSTLGWETRSTGDTEVVLHAYMQWGAECVKKFNGMWAFLIYDTQRKVIFGSRDRFGKKPLYYYRSAEHMFFGSEIKAILSSGRYRGELDWKKVSALLVDGRIESWEEDNKSFYSEIEQLPAGQAFELNFDGHFRQWSYWSLDVTQQTKLLANGDEGRHRLPPDPGGMSRPSQPCRAWFCLQRPARL